MRAKERAVNRHDFTVMWSRRVVVLLAALTLLASTVFGMGQSALAAPVSGDDIVLDGLPTAETASHDTPSLEPGGATNTPHDAAGTPLTKGVGEEGAAKAGVGEAEAAKAGADEAAPAVDDSSEAVAPGESATADSSAGLDESIVVKGEAASKKAESSDTPAVSEEPDGQVDSSDSAESTGPVGSDDASSPALSIGPQALGKAPEVLFNEDFENGTSGVPLALSSYTGKSGVKYSASSYWLDTKYCNGFITTAESSLTRNQVAQTYCGLNGDSTDGNLGDYNAVRTKAQALGDFANQMDGTNNTATKNRALSTNTSGGTPDNRMFESATHTLTLKNSPEKRFFAFSVDAAVTYEEGSVPNKPEMYFSLMKNGEPPTKLYEVGSPIPGSGGTWFDLYQKSPVKSNQKWASQGLVGRFYSNTFLLEGNQQIGFLLENFSRSSSEGCGAYSGNTANPNGCTGANANKKGTSNGNDGAIDNVRILDVSPTTEKAFSPARVPVGQTSTMTITVNNRTDLMKKDGWTFTDTLPAGLKFANATVSGTCMTNGSTATANVAAGQLTVTRGILPKGQESCTIVTTVTSDQATTFTNGGPNGNFSGLAGIDAPNNAQVTFYPLLTLQKNIVSRHNAGDQFTLTITPSDSAVTGASATTTGSATGVQGNRIAGPVELRAGVQYTLRETGASGANLANYQSSLACVDTVNANASIPVTPVSGTPGAYTLVSPQVPSAGLVNVVCTFMNQRIPDPKLTLVKTVENPAEGSGYAVVADWTLTATGTGDVRGTTISGKTGDASVTGATVKEGRYDLSETFATTPNKGAGYNWTDVVCRDASNNVISTSKSQDTSSGTSVVTDASVALERGDDVTCTFTNTPKLGSVTWTKTAEGKSDVLANSEWTITGPGVAQGGAQVEDCTSGNCAAFLDKDPAAGKFKLTGLTWGTYLLTETKAPAGYYLLEDPVTFTVGADGQVETSLGRLVNKPRDTPTLPLTGGIGRDHFFIVGAVVALAGGSAALVIQIRRRRKEVA